MTEIIVGLADLIVAHNPATLVTVGLGSCVGIAMRDPSARIGALAHILLPNITQSTYKENPLKFADSALEKAVQTMLENGCVKNRIEAKIAGGASMFNFGGMGMDIGARNVNAVTKKLEEMKIPLLASDTGGNYGRTLRYNIETGILVIKSSFHGIKEL